MEQMGFGDLPARGTNCKLKNRARWHTKQNENLFMLTLLALIIQQNPGLLHFCFS